MKAIWPSGLPATPWEPPGERVFLERRRILGRGGDDLLAVEVGDRKQRAGDVDVLWGQQGAGNTLMLPGCQAGSGPGCSSVATQRLPSGPVTIAWLPTISVIDVVVPASGDPGENVVTPPLCVTQRLPSGPAVMLHRLVEGSQLVFGDFAGRGDFRDVFSAFIERRGSTRRCRRGLRRSWCSSPRSRR